MNDAMIDLWRLRKEYDTPAGRTVAVAEFTYRARPGEFVCVIGHSGCGKSTVLSMVMGLTEPTEGTVIVAGKEVTGPGTDRGVVFQSAALLPWLTARENVVLAIEQVNGHHSRPELREIADRMLADVGLEGAGDRMPEELSAGMRQRVGIARAFALSPRLLLLDEPFGMLDSLTRWDLQDVLVETWNRTKVTAIMVTHDVDEAILLADRVVMMTNGPNATIGKILEVDLPRPRDRKALLDHPKFYQYRQEVLHFLAEYDHGPAAKAA